MKLSHVHFFHFAFIASYILRDIALNRSSNTQHHHIRDQQLRREIIRRNTKSVKVKVIHGNCCLKALLLLDLNHFGSQAVPEWKKQNRLSIKERSEN